MKRSCGAVSVDACCAMIAPETTMIQEGLGACNLVHSGEHPPCQVPVTPSPEVDPGRSVNRFVAVTTLVYMPDDTGVNESVAKLESFMKASRT